MKKRSFTVFVLAFIMAAATLTACGGEPAPASQKETPTSASAPAGWNGQSVTYTAYEISRFGSGTPYGYADLNTGSDSATIVNADASLDNYGGVQTPSLTLDFSKAVIFKMNVISCYSQYIVKLAVEGESEYYYVLSDDDRAGEISVNVVDSMLSSKYRERNTQPDPGYRTGWKYNGEKKNCSFHILAKGPDGEQQTAELVVKSISIFNNETAVTGVEIGGAGSGKQLTAKKGSSSVGLSAEVSPSSISDRSVTWSSLDESIATVDGNGRVSFVGVGKTSVIATSNIDQSKSDQVYVNVTSGYEDPADLKAGLETLTVDGSGKDAEKFADMFNTSWAAEEDMKQSLTFPSVKAADIRQGGATNYVYDHYDAANAEMVSEAATLAVGEGAYLYCVPTGASGAQAYRLIDGKLTKETVSGALRVKYLNKNNGAFEKCEGYTELTIFVLADGSVKKSKTEVKPCVKVASYGGADLADATLWTIPDRTKQNEDGVVHALSPASVSVSGGVATLKQNKYPEAKYCFGGIVSGLITVGAQSEAEIILDVNELNQMNDYVKTMWEIKIIYFENGKAVSSNPIKVASGNAAGVQDIVFRPAYSSFKLYLVVNGSDIGAQFAGAEMKISSMKIYSLDRGNK